MWQRAMPFSNTGHHAEVDLVKRQAACLLWGLPTFST